MILNPHHSPGASAVFQENSTSSPPNTIMPFATNTGDSPAYTARPGPESTWNYSILSLEKHMEVYRQASLKGDQREMEQAAENINFAMREAVGAQSNPELVSPPGKKSKDKSKSRLVKIRFPGANEEKESESSGRQITRGLLTILTTPIAFVGMGIYAVGLMVEGTGTILKGAGSLGRKAFVPPRKSSSKD